MGTQGIMSSHPDESSAALLLAAPRRQRQACRQPAQAAAMTARFGRRAGTLPPSTSSSTSTRSPGASRRTTAAHSTKGPVAMVTASPGCKSGGRRRAHAVCPGRLPEGGDEVFGQRLRARAVGEKPLHSEGAVDRAPRLARHVEFHEQIPWEKRCGPRLDAFRPPAGALHHRQPDPIPLARQVHLGSLLLMGPRMDHVPTLHRHSPFGSTIGMSLRAPGSRTLRNKGGASTCRYDTAPPTISAMAVR